MRELFKDDVPFLDHLTELPPRRDVDLELLRDGLRPMASENL